MAAILLPKLRNNFAEFLNGGYLDHLRLLASPTCVGCGYGRVLDSSTRIFLGAWRQPHRANALTSPLGVHEALDLPGASPYRLGGPANGRTGSLLAFSVPPSMSWSPSPRHGNINPSSIAYAFRPRLRSRLTLGGMTCPRKPWAYGEGDSRYPLALLVPA